LPALEQHLLQRLFPRALFAAESLEFTLQQLVRVQQCLPLLRQLFPRLQRRLMRERGANEGARGGEGEKEGETNGRVYPKP